MTGTLAIHSHPACILFDSGATRCFISSRFIVAHHIPVNTLASRWIISMGNENVYCNRECKECPIEIEGRRLRTNFLVIDDCEFDAILGMD